MTCGEYLARHSDYLDEELDAEAAAEMWVHMASCERCARYDRVLRRGLALVRELEPVRPSADGYLALQRHLARTTPAPPELGMPRASLAATIAVAGVVALVAWSALFRATGVPASAAGESAPRLPDAPVELSAEPADEGPGATAQPLLSGVDVILPMMHAPADRPVWLNAPAALVPTRARVLTPGPYTPLLLQTPDFGQGEDRIPLAGPR